MIDLETYRARIGCFCHRKRTNQESAFLDNLDLIVTLQRLLSVIQDQSSCDDQDPQTPLADDESTTGGSHLIQMWIIQIPG